MNVYDFDKTIYPGDSSFHFWLFCIRRKPSALLELPHTIPTAIRYILKKATLEDCKKSFMRYLRRIPDAEAYARRFWKENAGRIYPFYRERQEDGDVIISASPEFLISEICAILGVACIATRVDTKTGEFLSPNCRGEQKPARFRELYPEAEVDEFYSDSLSDIPMMKLASAGYLVRRGRIAEKIN